MLNPILCAIFATAFAPGPQGSGNPYADHIIHHAKIYTVNPAQPWAAAMAIKDGKILYVGDNSTALSYQGSQTQLVNLNGKMVMPGVGDSHIHLLEAHHPATGTVMLESGKSLEAYIPEIQASAGNQIGTDWVLGWGFSIIDVLIDQFFFVRDPLAILDEAVPNEPAAIMEETSHAIWVNSKAMAAAGIDENTPNPPGGVIMRNFWTGKPNGILLDTAGEMIMDLALERSPELDQLNVVALRYGYQEAAKNGITSLCEARAFWKRGYVDAYKYALQEGTVTARTTLGLWTYPDMDDAAQIAQLASMYENDPQSKLKISQIKIYADGITLMTTAALLEPYLKLQLADPLGLNYFSLPRLQNYLSQLEQIGFDFHIHAIGDRGVREALDAVQFGQQVNPTLPPRRHRITHVELVEPTDVPRFEQLGVIADFQMSSHFVLPGYDQDLRLLLGHDRVEERSLVMRDIWDTDAHLVLSSDYDVGSMSPFVGMQNALTRGPQSLPTVDAAIRAYTIEPAYLMRMEDVTGSLEVGKFADFIVLDRNIFNIPKWRIGRTKVLATVLEGETVYRR